MRPNADVFPLFPAVFRDTCSPVPTPYGGDTGERSCSGRQVFP
jgi:hypothetical protein